MNTKITDRTGQEYDFDRCTKEQLIAYALEAMTFGNIVPSSAYAAGVAVLAAAKVPPPKTRAEIFAEIGELLLAHTCEMFDDSHFQGLLISDAEASEVRKLVAQARKAAK